MRSARAVRLATEPPRQHGWRRPPAWALLLAGMAGFVASEFVPSIISLRDRGGAGDAQGAAEAPLRRERSLIWMAVGQRRFPITLAESASAQAFAAQLPLTLEMSELNGNEKHGELPKALPASASRLGKLHRGELMLYGSSTLVVFYETFSSSYSYTRLGRVEDPSGLPEALGSGSVSILFSKE